MNYLGIPSRCVLALGCLVTLIFGNLTSSADEATYTLKSGNQFSHFKVDSKLEAKGILVMDPTEKTRTVPMNVLANFRYDERLAKKDDKIKSVRFYDLAKSKVTLGTGAVIYELSSDNRYLILERLGNAQHEKRIRFQSPTATLTHQELDLIHAPGDSMVLTRWLETKEVALKEKWKTQDEYLADILTWDYVTENDVHAQITEINRSQASLHIAGQASGTIDGAAVEVSIKGTCIFDRENGFVSSIRLRLTENRDASLVSPGFEATIWLENVITPDRQGARLTNAALSKLNMSPTSRADQLLLKPKCGPYSLLHQRHWRVISNQNDRTVLRCIRDGMVLGQCDIIPLPNQPVGAVTTLEQFELNVKKALANNGGKVVHRQQSPSVTRDKWMRIDAIGESSDVDMRWIYYTVTSPDQRRVQLLFTLENDVFANFKGFDQEILNALEFEAESQSTSTPSERSASILEQRK